jgi:hypothetical protein
MSAYPLTRFSLLISAMVGALAYFATGIGLAAYVMFTLCFAVSLVWRRDEAPIFPFILFLQWIQVSSGYLLSLVTGSLPEADYALGDVDRALWLSLTGLILLALGIRVGSWRSNDQDVPLERVENLRGLFWLVMALYSANYVSLLGTKSFAGLDVVLERVLTLRQIPLLLLWFETFRQNRNREYMWISLVWVFIPALASYFSDFKTPIILALIVITSFWRPWERTWWSFSLSGAARTLALAALAIFLAMTWQAGVKRETRRLYDTEAVSANPLDRIQLFVTQSAAAVPIVFNDTAFVVDGLIGRLWYVGFFSRVLEQVPAREPHAEGELLQLATTNAFYPRFFFPDKPPLPSDSYYTRRFAGLNISDELGATSISIGYMAEFYADWGVRGLFISVFAYGLLMGFMAWVIRTVVRPRVLVDPALITVMLTVSFYEHQFVKTFGALNIAAIVTIGSLAIASRPFETFLRLRISRQPNAKRKAVLRPTLRPIRPPLP